MAARRLRAIATIVLLLALVMAPLLAVLGAGANDSAASPRRLSGHACSNSSISRASSTAYYGRSLATIASSRTGRRILTKAGELVGSASAFLFAALSATTRATGSLLSFTSLYCSIRCFSSCAAGRAFSGPFSPTCRSQRPKRAAHGGKVGVGHPRHAQGHESLIGAAQGVLGSLAFWAVGIE